MPAFPETDLIPTLRADLQQSHQLGTASGPSGGTASSTSGSPAIPPVITIKRDNPVIIHVGDTYSDLGATITGPSQDLNLGINVSVDGSATTPLDQISIDTCREQHTYDFVLRHRSKRRDGIRPPLCHCRSCHLHCRPDWRGGILVRAGE